MGVAGGDGGSEGGGVAGGLVGSLHGVCLGDLALGDDGVCGAGHFAVGVFVAAGVGGCGSPHFFCDSGSCDEFDGELEGDVCVLDLDLDLGVEDLLGFLGFGVVGPGGGECVSEGGGVAFGFAFEGVEGFVEEFVGDVGAGFPAADGFFELVAVDLHGWFPTLGY